MMALLFVTLPFVVRAVQPTLLELDRDMEEAAASLGASKLTVFRRIVMPNLSPAIFAGAALAFARAVGEFGSVDPDRGRRNKTQVSSIYIFSLIEGNGNEVGAAAVSLVLLLISLGVLLLIGFFGRRACAMSVEPVPQPAGGLGVDPEGRRLRGCRGEVLARYLTTRSYSLRSSAPVVMVFFRTFENGFAEAFDAARGGRPDGPRLTAADGRDRGTAEHDLRRRLRDRARPPQLPRQGDPERADRHPVRRLARGHRALAGAALRPGERVGRRVVSRAGE